jgi:hypothetical protein
VHLLNAGIMPPGAIGSQQLMRGGPLPGYFQPVEIVIPQGAQISTASDTQFDAPQSGPIVLGMLIGSVYRFRVTDIPTQETLEVYPTVEVVDRLYPPIGMEARFPIVIHFAQEDIELALAGKFVTRIVYLEDPDDAMPLAEKPLDQPYFEIARGQDPLEVADRLGRPVAIVRLGGRLPDAEGPDLAFLFGSPPFLRFSKPVAAALPANSAELPVRTPARTAASAGMPAAAGAVADRQTALPPGTKKRTRLSLQDAFRSRQNPQ